MPSSLRIPSWSLGVMSFAFPSPGHQPTKPSGALIHCATPSVPKAGIALVSTNAARTRSPKRSSGGTTELVRLVLRLLVIMVFLAFCLLVLCRPWLERANTYVSALYTKQKLCHPVVVRRLRANGSRKESYRAKVQRLGSTLAGAPWSSRHVSRACTQTSRLRIPLTRSGRTAGHLAEPGATVHSRAFCSACRRLRRVPGLGPKSRRRGCTCW